MMSYIYRVFLIVFAALVFLNTAQAREESDGERNSKITRKLHSINQKTEEQQALYPLHQVISGSEQGKFDDKKSTAYPVQKTNRVGVVTGLMALLLLSIEYNLYLFTPPAYIGDNCTLESYSNP